MKSLYLLNKTIRRDSSDLPFVETQAICPAFGASYVNSGYEK